MTEVLAILFISGFICTSSQYIYLNEQNYCNSNEKNTATHSTLLEEMRKIQHEVDELRRENKELKDLVSNITTNKLQQEVDELQVGYMEIKNLLTNLTLESSKRNTDCKDLYANRQTQSGVYEINPFSDERRFNVYCDMMTEGGGWTAIQKRRSGSVTFNRTWAEYKTGFGNPYDSFWIGNDVIHQLTKERNSSLFVSITLEYGTTLYELYQQFSVSGEDDNYRLYLGGPATGTLGDAMLDTALSTRNLSGMFFSTPDRDNDGASDGNCAVLYWGGWWFNACFFAYLNGPWSTSNNMWSPTVKGGIKETVMMIRHH